jgi:hypothetical protein
VVGGSGTWWEAVGRGGRKKDGLRGNAEYQQTMFAQRAESAETGGIW